MASMRVLLAFDPRLYREAVARMLWEMRPHLAIISTGPDGLDGELERLEPHLVLLDGAPSRVPTDVLAWVRVTTADQLDAIVCVDGRYSHIERMRVDDLLAIIDEAERLVCGE